MMMMLMMKKIMIINIITCMVKTTSIFSLRLRAMLFFNYNKSSIHKTTFSCTEQKAHTAQHIGTYVSWTSSLIFQKIIFANKMFPQTEVSDCNFFGAI